MYHRFNEGKYPSTNIQMDVFKEQLKIIEKEGLKFIHPKIFIKVYQKTNWKEKSFYCRRRFIIIL